MTTRTLDLDRLRAVAAMQREQIKSLRRRLQEEAAHKRRLQAQVIDLVGKLQEAKRTDTGNWVTADELTLLENGIVPHEWEETL